MKVSKKVPLIVYSTLGLLLLVALLVMLGGLLNRNLDRGERPAAGGASHHIEGPHGGYAGTYNTYPDEGGGNYPLGVFDEYEIRIPFGEVTIRPAKDAQPHAQISSDLRVEMRVREDGDTCKVDFDMVGHHWLGDADTQIDLYLPQARFHELELTLSAGTLELSGITADKLDIDITAGKAEVSDCAFDEIASDMSAGELTLRTGREVRKIECDVTAGSTKLCLPEDIGGFVLDYEATVGGFKDSTGLALSGSDSSKLVGKKGHWTYGDGLCAIDLEVTAGELVLSTY